MRRRSACQIWTGPTRNGYGWDGVMFAHRRAWLEAGGFLYPGYELHHACGVKLCVNVDHLELHTRAAHERIHGLR